MCGSTNILKQDGVFVCQSCGTKYSVEEAKKMMVEGTVDVTGSTVKVDKSDKLKNLYEIAHRAKYTENSENAAKYYDMILVEDAGSWEANYYVVYFASIRCKITDIWSAANNMANCQASVIGLINDRIQDPEEQQKAVTEVCLRNVKISSLLFNAAKNYYNGKKDQLRTQQQLQEYLNNASICVQIMYNFGDILDEIFDGRFSAESIQAWISGIGMHRQYISYVANKQGNISIINYYVDKICKYDSSFEKPQLYTPASISIKWFGGSQWLKAKWESIIGKLFSKL